MTKDKQQPEPLAWRYRYYGDTKERRWIVRQSPVEPFEPSPGMCGVEVEPLYGAEAIQSLRGVLEEWLEAVGPEQAKRARLKARTLLGDS